MTRMLLAVCLVLSGVVGVISSAHAVILYATDDVYNGLYTIDTSDGSYSLVGNYTITETFIGGLTWDGCQSFLYGISAGSGARLYEIYPLTGAAVDIGPLGIGFVFEGGLAFDPTDGTLYGVNQDLASSPHLFTVNTATGAGTVVGLIAGGDHDFAGLAFDDSGQLYGIDRVTDALWKIDKTNPAGAGTALVGTGLGGGIVVGVNGGVAKDPNGVVYGYGEVSNHLFTIDLALGTGTVIHTFGPDDPSFYSLSYWSTQGPSATEPTSWSGIKSMFNE